MTSAAGPAVLGIFVGGRATRFAGRDKSALPSPRGGTLLERHLDIGQALQLECVLVGGAHGDQTVRHVPRIMDDPADIGPLGGLAALLSFCDRRPAIALACDMPYVSAALVAKLLAAPEGDVVAPRDRATGKWSPLCARYNPLPCLDAVRRTLAAGDRSFQRCLTRLAVTELTLTPSEHTQLRDWDRPEDVPVDPPGEPAPS